MMCTFLIENVDQTDTYHIHSVSKKIEIITVRISLKDKESNHDCNDAKWTHFHNRINYKPDHRATRARLQQFLDYWSWVESNQFNFLEHK